MPIEEANNHVIGFFGLRKVGIHEEGMKKAVPDVQLGFHTGTCQFSLGEE